MSDVTIESGTPEMVAFKLYKSLMGCLPEDQSSEEAINSCLDLFDKCLLTAKGHGHKEERRVKFKVA